MSDLLQSLLPGALKASNDVPTCIEDGYFVFTLMPSLKCSLKCPHCYLSLEQRKSSEILSLDNLELAAGKVADYYRNTPLATKTVVCYWYGGEPTEMGIPYFTEAVRRIKTKMPEGEGFAIKHSVLSSLLMVNDEWFSVFRDVCAGEIQTSFDWTMRGKGYIKAWEKQVRAAQKAGLKVSTISVVNRDLINLGPVKTLDYLADLGIAETSWLPFMLNEQNAAGAHEKFAPSMNEYSDFMIHLSLLWLERDAKGETLPEIGQMRFILGQEQRGGQANIAGQTLFLMPNGDFSLPDYDLNGKEFLRPFGNILTQRFSEVLSSPARRAYIRKQVLRNHNEDCNACDHADKCLMEFWKKNRSGDDCFGASRYVQWLVDEQNNLPRKLNDALRPY